MLAQRAVSKPPLSLFITKRKTTTSDSAGDDRTEEEEAVKMRRRNPMSVPAGTHSQQAAIRLFERFMSESNITWADLADLQTCKPNGDPLPQHCLHSVLESWSRYLFNCESSKARNASGVLSHATADNYLSQIKQVISENYGTERGKAIFGATLRDQRSGKFPEILAFWFSTMRIAWNGFNFTELFQRILQSDWSFMGSELCDWT